MVDAGTVITGGYRVDLVRPDGVVITAHVALEKQPLATFVHVAMTEKAIPRGTPFSITRFSQERCHLQVQMEKLS